MAEPIYHLVPLSELRAGLRDAAYTPARFAVDGFVHCSATPASVLAVARDYFAGLSEPLLVVRIDPARLRARLVFEAPAPIAGGGVAHLAGATLFPHVYGAIEVVAIDGAGVLAPDGDGFSWPDRFEDLHRVVG